MRAMLDRFDLTNRTGLPDGLWDVLIALATAALGIALALAVHAVVSRLLRRIARASESGSDDLLITHLRRPTRWAAVVIGVILASRADPLILEVWSRVAGFVVPAVLGWIALATLRALIEAAVLKADITVADNLQARRKRTRLAIFSRIASFMIIFITVSLMLLSIPGVRDIGVTLMASAGLAGLAVGAAAQPALKSLIAGFQMAMTEPIRIDDAVILDGEFGRIEDIRTTYVVVRLWDERRLIVPATRFLEDTFQNWTRTGSELHGTVFLHLDPLAELDPIREEFIRLAQAHPLWDGRTAKLQVTETSRDSIEVRCLVSAGNSGDLFDMRCDLREGILAWIRENQPGAIAFDRLDAVLEPMPKGEGKREADSDRDGRRDQA